MHKHRPPADDQDMDSLIETGAIHAALEGIVTIDESMRIVMINPAAQRMFGRSASQALGRDLSILIPDALRASHAEHVRQFMGSDVVERPMAERGKLSALLTLAVAGGLSSLVYGGLLWWLKLDALRFFGAAVGKKFKK